MKRITLAAVKSFVKNNPGIDKFRAVEMLATSGTDDALIEAIDAIDRAIIKGVIRVEVRALYLSMGGRSER